ncbi:MAG: hypothetical protein ABI294_03475 [Casimicrobiaceae bacterium]
MAEARRAVGWLILGLAACSRDTRPLPRPAGPAGERLPALQLDHRSMAPETTPQLLEQAVEVAPNGDVAFAAAADDHDLYTVVDSGGRHHIRMIPAGEGPAEMQRPDVLVISDSYLTLSDLATSRVTVVRRDGTITSSHVVVPLLALAMEAGPGDLLTLTWDTRGPRPVLLHLATGVTRELMERPDSFLGTAFRGVDGSGSPRIPVLGRWSGGFIIADSWRYRLALYDWQGVRQRILGRDIPRPVLTPARIDTAFHHGQSRVNARRDPAAAARERAEIADQLQPHFPHTRHLGFDDQGRIWVFGIDADSGFADVFSATHFLGRIPLPCPAFASAAAVAGPWLALACGTTDAASDAGTELKVFRIVDPPGQ